MSDEPEFSPDTEEILRVEPDQMHMTAIPVVVEGQARVQDLPRDNFAGKTIIALGVTPKRILSAHPNRAEVDLYAWTDDILIGSSQFSFGDDTYGLQEDNAALKWPKGVVRKIRATGEVWVRAAATTTDLSVYRENWT